VVARRHQQAFSSMTDLLRYSANRSGYDNMETSVPQGLHCSISTFRLIYGSYHIVSNKPMSLKVWLIIPYILASIHGEFPAQALKVTALGQAAIPLLAN
jgi:hypothetical protein